MKIHRGTQRIVVEVPWLGIVLKFPIFRIKIMLKSFVEVFEYRRARKEPVDVEWLAEYFINDFWYQGFIENWNEFMNYLDELHPFLQPTYFSFGGLCNIQKLGAPTDVERSALVVQIQLYTEMHAFDHSHSFFGRSNYCKDSDGKLRMTDYGSDRAYVVIQRFGRRCHEKFSFTYIRNETDLRLLEEYRRAYQEEKEERAQEWLKSREK